MSAMVGGEESNKPGFSKEQKTGFVLLFIFALLALGLGFLQLRNNLYRPFALNDEIVPFDKDQVSSIEALQYRDTDYDGLNDFEELYNYKTSPYLEDTDSDGLNDGLEIKKGSNPLCYEGRECTDITDEEEYIASRVSTSTFAGQDLQEPSAEGADLEAVLSDPAQVRQILVSAGMDSQLLEKLSDEQLMVLVEQTLQSADLEQENFTEE